MTGGLKKPFSVLRRQLLKWTAAGWASYFIPFKIFNSKEEFNLIVRIHYSLDQNFSNLDSKYQNSHAISYVNRQFISRDLMSVTKSNSPGLTEWRYRFQDEAIYEVWKGLISENRLESWPMHKSVERIPGTSKLAAVRDVYV